MTTSESCDFCGIVEREEPVREVLRTPTVVAFFPTDPATLGHTLVIPREHIPDIWQVDDDTARDLAVATLRVATAVRTAMRIDGLNIIQSNGAAATQSVMHLHVHVVPRWDGDQMGSIWPENTYFSESAKNEAQDKVRAALGAGPQGEQQE